jgi:hypothetical protein
MNISIGTILGIAGQVIPMIIILVVAVRNRKNVFDVNE